MATSADELLDRLTALPNVTVTEIDSLEGFQRHFELQIVQPVDHQNANSETFRQKVYLAHRDLTAPMVMIHQGYAATRNRQSELAQLLEANQIRIEHRYFDQSRPEKLDWQYMTVKQSADDENHILSLLQQIYTGAWVNTGISKGGQSSLYFRHYYPDAVQATVAYVAPLNLAVEDPRLNRFLMEVGDADCRNHIKALQRSLLERRDDLIPMVQQWSDERKDHLLFGAAATLEYAVMEYSFAFWQSGGDCAKLPDLATSSADLFDNLRRTVGFGLFAASGAERFGPFFYQAYHELGYYNFNVSHLKDLLEVVTDSSNIVFVPEGIRPVYRAETMQNVNRWLQSEARNVLCIYGETDAWSATAVDAGSNSHVLKMVKAGGAHATRIASFDQPDQDKMLATIKAWLQDEEDEPSSGFTETFQLLNSIMLLGIVMFLGLLIFMRLARRK